MIGTVPPARLDLFDPPSPLLGLRVVRSESCPKCRSFIATIGTGKPSHVASLICAVCHRFVNPDFIRHHRLAWIDNLETSSGERLDDHNYLDHYKDYVQSYIKRFGVRKVEANALVVCPEAARELCRQAILKYVSQLAIEKYRRRLAAEQRKVQRAVKQLLNGGAS
jgi:hypothetical protein